MKKEVVSKPSKIKKSMRIFSEQQKSEKRGDNKLTQDSGLCDPPSEDSGDNQEESISECEDRTVNQDREEVKDDAREIENANQGPDVPPNGLLLLVKAREAFFNSADGKNRGTVPLDIKIRG